MFSLKFLPCYGFIFKITDEIGLFMKIWSHTVCIGYTPKARLLSDLARHKDAKSLSNRCNQLVLTNQVDK